MLDELALDREFFQMLERTDAAIAEAVRVGRCPRCRGPLHRGDYRRKPRGGRAATAGESQTRRYSFCCGRDGCRRRATPPSLRFLGRRVYLEATVIVASVLGLAFARARDVRDATGLPPRTVRRWLSWWSGPFVMSQVFVSLRAAFVGAARARLPLAILEHMPGAAIDRVVRFERWLAPLTTASISDGSRFVGAVS